jgi:hypothetical protein
VVPDGQVELRKWQTPVTLLQQARTVVGQVPPAPLQDVPMFAKIRGETQSPSVAMVQLPSGAQQAPDIARHGLVGRHVVPFPW